VTHEQLDELHRALWTLREYLDDEANVPQRFTSSAAGALSSMDVAAISTAADVAHRLMLWKKFPQVSPESYFVGVPTLVEAIEAYSERVS
jgi:hypothetical protein